MRGDFVSKDLRVLIRLEGDHLALRGIYGQIADAIGALEKIKPGEVPDSMPVWRARQDLNPRPLGS